MQRELGVTLMLATLLCAGAAAQTFEQRFQAPPEDARVMMRWWWFGPAVTKPELLREMQEMKAAGVGGFEIQPVYPLALDAPETGFRNLPYLSDEFLQAVRFANDEGVKLGMRVSLTLTSGWPYGGRYTPVTEAAGAIHLEMTDVGPAETSVATPALGAGEKLEAAFSAGPEWNGNNGSGAPTMLSLPAPGSARMVLPTGAARPGKVLWFISTRTGQQVKRAAVDADGFVLDHFSQPAVENHLHHVADRLMTAFDTRPPYSVFSDSLEVYGSDWTPDFLAEFQRRRGYDLRPHLPELFTALPTDEALAVRHDWGETLTELVDDNYLKPIDAWAREHHTLFRSQTYGDPAVSLASNALADLPEGEGPQWRQFSYTRWATSAAHVYGRPVVSAETWTWLHSPAFRATPLDMKAEADRFFLQGINQLVGHGWPYSPASAGEPGWRFYAAGAFNAHNPWWLVMPDVMRYMQRVSWALRQGEPANDIAIYLPEDDAYAAFTPGQVSLTETLPRWITPELTAVIEDSGYNFDYIDAEAMAQRGISYPVLLLPNVDRISAATLQQIAQYCGRGGKVIALGQLPDRAPGLQGSAEQSASVRAEAKRLFSEANGQCVLIGDLAQLGPTLHRLQPPDMQLATPAPSVGFIHRRLAVGDLYLIANTGNTPVHTSVSFRSEHKDGEWLDADDGTTRPVNASHPLQLDLAPYESRLLLLREGSAGSEKAKSATANVIADLSHDWSVSFGDGKLARTVIMPSLASWTETPALRFYSGVAVYRRSFQLTAANHQHVILTFGEGTPPTVVSQVKGHPGMQAELDAPIRDAAVVYVNGKRAGSLWHPPYEVHVTGLIRPGGNTIEIRVANTAINELAGQEQPDYRLLWSRYGKRFEPQDMDHLVPLPSGVLGSVRLLEKSAH